MIPDSPGIDEWVLSIVAHAGLWVRDPYRDPAFRTASDLPCVRSGHLYSLTTPTIEADIRVGRLGRFLRCWRLYFRFTLCLFPRLPPGCRTCAEFVMGCLFFPRKHLQKRFLISFHHDPFGLKHENCQAESGQETSDVSDVGDPLAAAHSSPDIEGEP